MPRSRLLLACLTLLLLAGLCSAADLPLSTASGVVISSNTSKLLVRPRNAEGQFEKALALKVTGTSKFAMLVTRKQGAKLVPVQQEASATDLQKNQGVAVIYTNTGSEYVLLTAVAHAARK
jgi:hypothetical protein